MLRKLVIVGGGPAGYTAGVYAGRALLEPLLLGGHALGGQLMLTADVENFPGFEEAVGGPALMQAMRTQAERFGTEIIAEDVDTLDLSQRPFRLRSSLGREVLAESLIIATGAQARWLGAENEALFQGTGLSTCATCDGALCVDKKVVVVGGGDAAAEEALFLTKFAASVTLIHRRDAFRASKLLMDRVAQNKKIELRPWRVVDAWLPSTGRSPEPGPPPQEGNMDGTSSDTTDAIGALFGSSSSGGGSGGGGAAMTFNRGPVLGGVRLRNVEPGVGANAGTFEEINCEAGFIAIGHDPATAWLAGQIELDEAGYILPHGRPEGSATATSVPGVFAAGDVVDHVYRQAVTAAGMGCMAALDAEKFLVENPLTDG